LANNVLARLKLSNAQLQRMHTLAGPSRLLNALCALAALQQAISGSKLPQWMLTRTS
jgi:hypothetical protein